MATTTTTAALGGGPSEAAVASAGAPLVSDTVFNEYQRKHSFERRLKRAQRVLEKNPLDKFGGKARVPIVVYYDVTELAKQNPQYFRVMSTATIDTLIKAVKDRINLSKEQTLMFRTEARARSTERVVLQGGKSLHEVYDSYKSDDQFLYLAYSLPVTGG